MIQHYLTKHIFSKLLFFFVILSILVSCAENEESGVLLPIDGNNGPGNIAVKPSPEEKVLAQFEGVSDITSVSETEVTINWEHIDGVGAYIIFFVEDGTPVFNKSVKAPTDSTKIKNLNDGVKYTFLVWPMSPEGLIVENDVMVDVTTLSYRVFENSMSLLFGNGQFVELPESDTLMGHTSKFTASVWFKTEINQTNESRLITIHQESGPSSAFNLALNESYVSLGYRDSDNDYQRLKYFFDYDDGDWHNVTVSYNGNQYKLYFDFQIEEQVTDSFSGFGRSPAIIGSFDGTGYFLDVVMVDEISLWKKALGSADILSLRDSGLPADLIKHRRKSSLISWWRFGDNASDSGNLLKDEISGHDGILTNFATEPYDVGNF